MSFWTSVEYCYPAVKPPVVTTIQLADLLEQVRTLEWLNPPPFPSLKVKFGKTIDKNHRLLTDEVSAGIPGVSRLRSQKLDLSLSPRDKRTEGDALLMLRKREHAIYRAFMSLGRFPKEMVEEFNFQTEENSHGVFLEGISFEIGPVGIGDLNDTYVEDVGWMSLGVSGPGYCFPVMPREVMERVRSDDRLSAVAEIVRKMWPVNAGRPPKHIAKQRLEMGVRYGGVSPDEPLDWFWAIDES